MFLPSFQLQNKIAMVTGAGRGIGRALAIGLAEAGADVAIFARTAKDLETVAEEIRAQGRQAYPFQVDVTSREQIEEAVRNLIEKTGRIDILINNAGMNIRSQALAVTDEEWDKIMQTNLKSAFLCSQIVGEQMKEQAYGRIINIASVAGQVALRTGVVYAATKAAMIQMTKVLALEWGKFGINVNSIGPWYFKTPLTETILANPDFLADIIARTPLRRIGELEELVGPAVFLASDAANYVTGQTLIVDGGMTIYGF